MPRVGGPLGPRADARPCSKGFTSFVRTARFALMTEYKEIIVALIAVFGAVLPYLLHKNKELNLKIAEQ